MKRMSVDELLMYEHKVAKLRRAFFVQLILYISIAATTQIFGLYATMGVVGIAAMLAQQICGISMLATVWVRNKLCARFFRSIDSYLDDVPSRVKHNAALVFGVDWSLAAIECHESHMPGDFGIHFKIDRETGQLTDCFLPRYAEGQEV